MLLVTLAALFAAASATAQPPLSAKRAEAQRVFADVQALDAGLGRADERLNLANIQLAQARHELVVNQHELKVAKANLKLSQKMIAERLVTLYTSPQISTLEVILGASNLDDVLTRVDTANRVSSLDTDVLDQVLTFKGAIKRHRIALLKARLTARHLVAERAAVSRSVARQLGERRRLLASINGQVAALEAAQRAQELQLANAARAQTFEAQATAQVNYANTTVGAFTLSPSAPFSQPASPYAGAANVALQFLGTPYVWAGASPSGFDCSGLVVYAFQQVGVSLPHSSYALWNEGVPVSTSALEPGDLVFFDGLGHMGIYIGGGEFVHSPHTGDVVRVDSLYGHYGSSLVGARRIL